MNSLKDGSIITCASGEWLSGLVSCKSGGYTAGLQEWTNKLFKKLETLIERVHPPALRHWLERLALGLQRNSISDMRCESKQRTYLNKGHLAFAIGADEAVRGAASVLNREPSPFELL